MPQQYTVRDNTTGRTVTFAWNGEQPPTEADMQEVFAAVPASQPGKSLGGFVSNIGTDIADTAKGLAQTVMHPLDTVRGMVRNKQEENDAAMQDIDALMRGERPGLGFNPGGLARRVGDAVYEQPVSTALALSPLGAPLLRQASPTLRAAGLNTMRGAAGFMKHPGGGALVGGATGALTGGPTGAALGAMTGATTGPRLGRDLARLADRLDPPPVPKATPSPGARLVRGSTAPTTLEDELLTVMDELRHPTPKGSTVAPSHPSGGGVTLPPDVPIPTDKTYRRIAPFAKNARARYRELTTKTILTPAEASELTQLEQIVKSQAQASGMSYAAGGK